jgi:hypothetical protein
MKSRWLCLLLLFVEPLLFALIPLPDRIDLNCTYQPPHPPFQDMIAAYYGYCY